MVSMCVIDPMHAFLLVLVEKESSRHLCDDYNSPLFKFAIPMTKRKEFKRRLKSVPVPSDIGRLPSSLPDKRTASGFTAQQWMNYACTYARPCLVGLIPADAYLSMRLLCEVVENAMKHVLSPDDIATLELKLGQHHDLYCKLYGN